MHPYGRLNSVDAPLHLSLQTPRRIRTRSQESNPRAPTHATMRGLCAVPGEGWGRPAAIE
jgi:hypothetical protein